jgi:spoIIIJ-associated protein
MEWVETTGRSVQEAKEAALDELGVDEVDAEFEVLADAQTGLFGRLRSEARVRARVRPTAPRAKEDRRSRDRKRRAASGAGGAAATTTGSGTTTGSATTTGSESGSETSGGGGATAAADRADRADRGRSGTNADTSGRRRPSESAGTAGAGPRREASADEGEADDGPTDGGPRRRRRRGGRRPGSVPTGGGPDTAPASARSDVDDPDFDNPDPTKGPEVEVDLDRQAEVAVGFLTQLTNEFGLEAKVSVARPDEDTVEVQLTGSDLGILIGPKGATLQAVQNLTRTVVFNETGGNNGHINVDVAGYRQKRSEALARFATQVAEQVKSTGDRTALEPMSAVDRKVVHDTISAIDGVNTVSEGEDPHRRVVVVPA